VPAARSSISNGLDSRRAWLKHETDTKRLAAESERRSDSADGPVYSASARPAVRQNAAASATFPFTPLVAGTGRGGGSSRGDRCYRPPMIPLRSAHLLALLAAVGAAAISACSSGSQPVSCPAGQTACDGLCFDLQADPLSCGTCLRRCPTGATCSAGACTCPAGGSVCGAAPGACFDLATDPTHCGGCDLSCGLGTCAGSTCTCDSGTTTCPGPGAQCVDTLTDTGNCGACRNACAAGQSCEAGTCLCLSPRLDCGGDCIDPQTDERHCGSCANACATGATCSGGSCQCPGTTPDTCGQACVDRSTDEANCGTCGTTCPTGATCTSGTCSCPGGQTQCGSVCADLSTDRDHCGTCTTACPAAQSCAQGTCCPAGQFACNTGSGTSCCGGTACCAGGCQTAHANGLGQSYFDCGALDTYNRTTAQLAAAAWSPTGGTDFDLPVGECFSRQISNACATWCFAGPFTGQVNLNTISIACLLPSTGSPRWH
jgi:hypothetical protein